MKKRILVIEDDRNVRDNIDSLLSEEGYNVLAASDGEEGMVIAENEIPDLIICDIMMPRLSGYDVLNALSNKKETKKIPFIFLTAKAEKDDVRKGMNLGADDYLLKPFDADDLLSCISSRLKKLENYKAGFMSDSVETEDKKLSLDDKLFVQVNYKTSLVNISDIAAVVAQRQYTNLFLVEKKSFLLRKSISTWEEILPKRKFIRIHRSTIINLDHLVKLEAWFNAGYQVYIKNFEEPFTVSRRYASKFKDKLIK